MKDNDSESRLKPYLSFWGALALAFGYAVGWGAFMMPGTTFLPCAGPLGTVIGVSLGALAMVIFAINYHRMTLRYSGSAEHLFGKFGVALMSTLMVAGQVTGIIAALVATSRLMHAVSNSEILPRRSATTSGRRSTPSSAFRRCSRRASRRRMNMIRRSIPSS